MLLQIADLDSSIDMDRAALLSIVGAEQYLGTSRVRSGAWGNTSSHSFSRNSTKTVGGIFGLFGKKQKIRTTYRHQHQARKQYRHKSYKVSVDYL
jgi:hypothetical protein